jgi:UDP-glucose:O-linked fucose beta-1,3-glucosyltransferase
LKGERTDEEKKVLLGRIEELNGLLRSQNSKQALLASQLKKSQEDIRHSKKELSSLKTKKESIVTSINELHLYNNGAVS